jgi:anti-sigma factor RsiW
MSGCQGIGERLDAYHDAELGAVARWQVRRHLARCAPCRAELADLARVGGWVRSSQPDVAGPELWAGIVARLHAPQEPARARMPRLSFGFPAFGAAAAAAAAAAVALFLLQPTVFGIEELDGVRSLDTHGRPVMVLESAEQPTIIWLMDEKESVPEVWKSVWI